MAWKEITLFISSTFNDMQAERDYIKNKVLGRLNHSLEKHQISVRLLDLRWGIDTHLEDEESCEDKVLHVCLDLIRNTRPYFIALLGHRYGWIPGPSKQKDVQSSFLQQDKIEIPDAQDRSVTEMEILLGALGREDYIDHSFFFFREEDSYNGMDLETLCQYDDRKSSDENVRFHYFARLKPLKQKIKQVCSDLGGKQRVFPYLCRWNGVELTDFKEFGDTLYNLLYEDIVNTIDYELEVTPESALQDAFCQSRQKGFSGREDFLNQIIQHIEQFTKEHVELDYEHNEKSVNGIVLYGPSGCGKSSIYGELVRRMEQDNRFCPKYVSCGLSSCSSSLSTIEQYWNERFGLNEQIVEQGKRCIYLVDSVENIVRIREVADRFTHYSNTVNPYVLTCTEEYLDTLKQEMSFYQGLSYKKGDCLYIRIPDVTIKDAKEVISSVLNDNYKQLSPSCQQLLCSRLREGDNSQCFLFWLRLALSVLMEFSAEDFRKIHVLSAKNDSDKIERYLIQTIESFPNTLDGMIGYFIRLTYSFFDKRTTDALLYYLTHSRFGLTIQNFEELLGKHWDSLEFENLAYWFREFIRKDTYTGRLTIGHRLFHQVADNILGMSSDLPALFKRLHEEGKIENREYLYVVIQNGNVDYFYDYLLTGNGYLPDVVPPVIASFVKDNEEECFVFLSSYFSKYCTEPLNGELVFSVSWGLTEDVGEGYRLLKRAIDILLKQFTFDIVRNGDMDVLHAYFKFCLSITMEYKRTYYYNLKNPIHFEDVMSVYVDNKRLYGTRIVQWWLPSTFFKIWGINLWKNTKVVDYLAFEEECRWYCEHIGNIGPCIELFSMWVNCIIIPHNSPSYSLDMEEELHILQIVQNDFLSLLSPELEKDVFWFPRYLKEGLKLIDYYREGHCRVLWGHSTSIPFVPTELSIYIEKMIEDNPNRFFNSDDYDDEGVAVIKWSGGEIRHILDERLFNKDGLRELEHELIPYYLWLIEDRNSDITKLYDISIWSQDLNRRMCSSKRIAWNEIVCDVMEVADTECFVVYEFPKPIKESLAKYGAIYINKLKKVYVYYTLEKSFNDYILYSTTIDNHFDLGKRSDMSKEEFVKEICHLSEIDETLLEKKKVVRI